MAKKLSDQVREQVMRIYASVGNEEMEEDMYSIVLIHTLLEEMDKTADELRKDLGRLRAEALQNEKRLEAEKEELKKKLEKLENEKEERTKQPETDFSKLLDELPDEW